MDNEASDASKRVPPYVSFKTLCTLLDDLKDGGIPNRIDRSILTRFAGGTGSQILAALRALYLIDEKGKPEPELRRLIEARGTDAWGMELRAALWRGFPFLKGVDLEGLSPSQFSELFDSVGAAPDVARKIRTFFLHAASEADIPVTGRVTRATRRPASGSRSKGNRNAPTKKTRLRNAGKADSERQSHATAADQTTILIGKFPKFDPAWPPEIQNAWFQGFNRLMDSVRDRQEHRATGEDPESSVA